MNEGSYYLPLSKAEMDMFDDVSAAVCNEHGYSSIRKSYPYIRLDMTSFRHTVKRYLRPGMRVVDVGCGAGDKLVAFDRLCPNMYVGGIEHNPTMAAYARYVAPFASVIETDALKFNYHGYDLIYMYCPLSDPDLQSQLQWQVMMTMPRGAVFVCFLQQQSKYYPEFPDLRGGWRKY